MEIMDKVNIASSDIPGSSATKVTMRNQIRALMHWLGSPTLFVTINPADVFSPLFCHLAGCLVDLDSCHPELPTDFERRLLLARNPAAGARFFNHIMQTFIDVVLKMNSKDGGLFGKVAGYYGTIEAQGRGSLHCHMMIWVEGSLGPQALRDSVKCAEFQKELFEYLEDMIKSGLPGDVAPVPLEKSDRPERPPEETHPCSLRCPHPDSEEFEREWARQLLRTVLDCNYHVHSETCWKYLKPEEPRDHEHCRMRIDGSTRDMTVVDEETGSILLRHFHPFINNYNEVLIMLTKCNIDLKFIGSGEGAKALIYYITDYITKTSLPTHVAFAALQLVIDKVKLQAGAGSDPFSPSDYESLGRLTIVKACNALLGNQELSGQQVNIHLLGLADGLGDHYTSHTFRTLHWAAVKGWVRAQSREDSDPEEPAPRPEDLAVPDEEEVHITPVDAEPEYEASPQLDSHSEEQEAVLPEDEEITLALNPLQSTVAACSSSQVDDYRYRGAELEDVSLYWFVAMSEKTTCSSYQKQLGKRKRSEIEDDPQNVPLTESKAAPRVRFLPDHSQAESHLMRLRSRLVVPVLLGPTLGKVNSEPEKHGLDMLLLFKPWRQLSDLKHDNESWSLAFETARSSFPPRSLTVISNMNRLHECKDAKDKYSLLRRAGVLKGNLIDDSLLPPTGTTSTMHVRDHDDNEILQIIQGFGLDTSSLNDEADSGVGSIAAQPVSWREQLSTTAVQTALKKGIHIAVPPTSDGVVLEDGALTETAVSDAILSKQRKDLEAYKVRLSVEGGLEEDTAHSDRSIPSLSHSSSLTSAPPALTHDPESSANSRLDLQTLIRNISLEYGLNPAQERAFGIIAQHKAIGDTSQLLLIVAGPGGTGKSRIIDAVTTLFARLAEPQRLKKVAPTGIASYAIGGTTVHSLLNLCSNQFSQRAVEKAQTRLAGVTHIIIDEFSMLGARLTSKLSTRLGQVAGSSLPFGGYHMAFCGDVAQLPPVRDVSLWGGFHPSSTLQHAVAISAAPKKKGQIETHGRGLWRGCSEVVVLEENHRAASDPAFVAMLERIRIGKATTVDWSLLLSRKLDTGREVASFYIAAWKTPTT